MIKEETKRSMIINVGFVIEIFLFMFTGLLAAYLSWLAIGFFLLGIFVALRVGKEIEKEARSKLKKELLKRVDRNGM